MRPRSLSTSPPKSWFKQGLAVGTEWPMDKEICELYAIASDGVVKGTPD
jgi:hypothetical protein